MRTAGPLALLRSGANEVAYVTLQNAALRIQAPGLLENVIDSESRFKDTDTSLSAQAAAGSLP